MEYQAALKYYRAMQRKTAPGKPSKKAAKAKTKDPQRDSARREQAGRSSQRPNEALNPEEERHG